MAAYVEAGAQARGSARSEQEVDLVAAALRCIARFGWSKTTLEDVAREAGCSRATVYRVFPGGKEALGEFVLSSERDRLFGLLAQRIDSAVTLEDALVDAMSAAWGWISAHEALQFMLAHEPDLVLPFVSFSALDDVLEVVRELSVPHLVRWLPEGDAGRLAQWAARLVISFLDDPSDVVEVTRPESVRQLVRTFVLPGAHVLSKERAEMTLTA